MSWYTTERYHPIQAGSIDGVDVRPHDRAVRRAVRAQHDGLYHAFEDALDRKSDPYLTLFVGRLGATTGTYVRCLMTPTAGFLNEQLLGFRNDCRDGLAD